MAAALDGARGGRQRLVQHDADRDRRDAEVAASGETASFERLYRRHAARIHTLARRLLGASRADDATQEVFLLAWRKLGGYRGEGEFGGWLFRLARNWMLTEVGRAARESRSAGLEEAEGLVAPAGEPGRAMDLEAAVERLPEGARQVLTLRHFAGCSHEEIASVLGISVGTSKSQLHRARLLLRDGLEGAGSTIGPRGCE